MPTHSGLDCFCHSHLGHNTTGLGRGESCKWSCKVGGGVVTSFLNCMAAQHLLWPLQHSPLPVSLCPLWQEPGQKSLSMLWADSMPMGARPMAREKGFQYRYLSWAQRRFCTGHWRLHIDGGQAWDSSELSHQHQFRFTQPLRGGSATPFYLTGHFPFSPQ